MNCSHCAEYEKCPLVTNSEARKIFKCKYSQEEKREEIKRKIEALRKTYDMHEAQFLQLKRFIESEIAKLEKELMSAN